MKGKAEKRASQQASRWADRTTNPASFFAGKGDGPEGFGNVKAGDGDGETADVDALAPSAQLVHQSCEYDSLLFRIDTQSRGRDGTR